jgi:hypothetical protein
MSGRVVNVYREEYDVYVGRQEAFGNTMFGNIFSHLSLSRTSATFNVETREEAVALFKLWMEDNLYIYRRFPILSQSSWERRRKLILAGLPRLVGKRLGCHCHPLLCHADVLLEMTETEAGKHHTQLSSTNTKPLGVGRR